MVKRVHNFNAGPAALPLPVLESVKEDLISYKGEGLSVMEMSHRGKTFDGIIKDAESLIKEVFKLSDDFKVIFMQGGATLQFAAVPLNLLTANHFADYINTGSWSKKAIAEAKKLGKQYNVIASSEEDNFSHIPDKFKIDPDAAYLHITSNNTIFGTQWQSYPDTGRVPLVCDMSSDIGCRQVDINKFGLVYAGAQKNIGPAGLTLVIIRKDSLYNTPPTFGIYLIKLVMEWIKNNGGLKGVEEINKEKAQLIYDTIDSTDFFKGTVKNDSRSIMNVTFRLPSEELEKKFIEKAANHDIIGVKGHRSVGGIRASIYNAVPLESVKALVDFMKSFERHNG